MGEAIESQGPGRFPVDYPGDISVELLAERDSRREEAQPCNGGVQIQLIPGRSACEASIDM